MKKSVLIAVFVFLIAGSSFAQKFAFVDTEYILGRIPSYKAAQEQLDKISADYQKEIEAKYQEVDKIYKDFQKEKVLLTEDQKNKKEDEIMAKEKEIKDLQKKYFGDDGAVFQKRQELVKPIQDEIYRVVKEMAIEGAYAVIFDTASGAGILYENAKYNKSDEVLEKLGYTK
ncbi:MAG: OmpH family outer membrane protein [Bacteroidales bacterium]|nr:OmpH family outer membrane protein [Bacteroidales bacterium]